MTHEPDFRVESPNPAYSDLVMIRHYISADDCAILGEQTPTSPSPSPHDLRQRALEAMRRATFQPQHSCHVFLTRCVLTD